MAAKKNTKRGYFILETTIFLPIFIIAILLIGYLIKLAAIEENVTHTMADEARKLARTAYVLSVAPTFSHGLTDRILKENPDIEALDIAEFRYLFTDGSMDGQIRVKLDYTVGVKLPLGFYDGFDREAEILFRGFVGSRRQPESMAFCEMEKEKESCIVWVFPRAGEKYHKEVCSYIKVEPRQVLLGKSVRRKYEPCSICGPEHLPNGGLVYCFFKAGDAYHTGRCPTVDRYVVSMEKESAVKKGYRPCLKCGG